MWKHSGGVPCSLSPFLQVRAEMGRMLDCRMTNGAGKGTAALIGNSSDIQRLVMVDESVGEGGASLTTTSGWRGCSDSGLATDRAPGQVLSQWSPAPRPALPDTLSGRQGHAKRATKAVSERCSRYPVRS